jgi:Holliday junction resolvase RusA-like endonuclease
MEVYSLQIPWQLLVSSNRRNTRRGGMAHSWEYKRSLKLIHEYARFHLPQLRGPAFPEGEIEVQVTFHPPDARRRDVHNYTKGLLDALEGVMYANDYQIDRLSVVRCAPRQEACCMVLVSR